MTKIQSSRNIIVNGNFKTSKFDKYYFITNQFVNEEEIEDSSVFNDFNNQLTTKDIIIIVNPVQLSIYSVESENEDKLDRVLIKIMKTSNDHISDIRTFGMNFDWILPAKDENEMHSKTQNLFYNKESELITSFDSNDSIFGYYASKDIEDSRLKLDIKPVKYLDKNDITKTALDGLSVKFNFHFEKKDNMIPYIENYDKYKKISTDLVNLIKW